MSRPSKRYRPDNSDVSPSQQVVRNMKEQLTRAFAMISCLQREKEAIQKQLLKQQPAMDVATLLKNQRRNFHSWSVQQARDEQLPIYRLSDLKKAAEMHNFADFVNFFQDLICDGCDERQYEEHLDKLTVATLYQLISALPTTSPFQKDVSTFCLSHGLDRKAVNTLYHMGIGQSRTVCVNSERKLTTERFAQGLATWVQTREKEAEAHNFHLRWTIIWDGFYAPRYMRYPTGAGNRDPLTGTTCVMVAHKVPAQDLGQDPRSVFARPTDAAQVRAAMPNILSKIATSAMVHCSGRFWEDFSDQDGLTSSYSGERVWASLARANPQLWDKLHASFCLRENVRLVDYFPQWRTERKDDIRPLLEHFGKMECLTQLAVKSSLLSPSDRWVFMPIAEFLYRQSAAEQNALDARQEQLTHDTRHQARRREQVYEDPVNSATEQRIPARHDTLGHVLKVLPVAGMYHFGYIDQKTLRKYACNLQYLTLIFWLEQILPTALFFYHYLFRWQLGQGHSNEFQQWVAFILWSTFGGRRSAYYDRACLTTLLQMETCDLSTLRDIEACPAMLCERYVELVHSQFRHVYRRDLSNDYNLRAFRSLYHNAETQRVFRAGFYDEYFPAPCKVKERHCNESFVKDVGKGLKKMLNTVTKRDSDNIKAHIAELDEQTSAIKKLKPIKMPDLQPFGTVRVTYAAAMGAPPPPTAAGQPQPQVPQPGTAAGAAPETTQQPQGARGFNPVFVLSPGVRSDVAAKRIISANDFLARACSVCKRPVCKTKNDWFVHNQCFYHRFHDRCHENKTTCALCQETAKAEIGQLLTQAPNHIWAQQDIGVHDQDEEEELVLFHPIPGEDDDPESDPATHHEGGGVDPTNTWIQ
eukprot:m.126165 g.126165  ORF g.126165 m.126165 type:complete len:869 (-) comp9702_c0_seq5:17-2623(-)